MICLSGINTRACAVATVTSEYCRANNALTIDQPTSGYIASIVTSDTPGCDGSRKPWVISALPGQLINLTLYDFTVELPTTPSASGGGGGSTARKTSAVSAAVMSRPPHHAGTSAALAGGVDGGDDPMDGGSVSRRPASAAASCRKYGTIKDSGRADRAPMTICGSSDVRVSALYRSSGNVVKIWITAGLSPRDLQRFIIGYTGRWPPR